VGRDQRRRALSRFEWCRTYQDYPRGFWRARIPISPVDGSCFLCGCLPKINDDRQGTSGYPKFGDGERNRAHSPLIFHKWLFVKARYRRGICETTLCGGASERLFAPIPGAVRPRDESAPIWRRGAYPRFGDDVTKGSVPLERIFGYSLLHTTSDIEYHNP
jgi:hypothetical protein